MIKSTIFVSLFLFANHLFSLNKSQEHNIIGLPNPFEIYDQTQSEEYCSELNENDCNLESKCSWCVSGAVKSSCHSLENANLLPSSVFNCKKLNSISELDLNENEDINSQLFYDDYFLSSGDDIVNINMDTNLIHPRWNDFLIFMERFNKKYSDEELDIRFSNFINNLERIENNEFNFELGLNHFADMNEEEFSNFIHINGNSNGYYDKNGEFGKVSCKDFTSNITSPSALPRSIDWREKGAVTPVKDQGKCGSCWSFSSTGSMEGAWKLKTGQLISFSEQQLMDCSIRYGNSGCNGGLMDNGFEYAIENGMCAENEKPYLAHSEVCGNCNKVAHFSHCIDVTSMNELHLKEAVSRGPVSVAIEADTLVFQLYSGGVIDNVKCGTNLDHGVLVVGYGEEDGKQYWIVKNSWGPHWGDNGYVKIARSDNTNTPGMCGIALSASFIVA